MAAVSLPLVISNILDKIGSENESAFDFTLPDPQTQDSLILQQSLRSLISRIHNTPPIPKAVEVVKEPGTCATCGHRINNVPLTPEETPPIGDVTAYVPKTLRWILSFVPGLFSDSTSNGYESSASDTTTISVPPTPDATVHPLRID
jgi:hypothetical protein